MSSIHLIYTGCLVIMSYETCLIARQMMKMNCLRIYVHYDSYWNAGKLEKESVM